MLNPAPATLAQSGIWLTERAGAAATAYHLPLTLAFDGPLDAAALLRACQAVVARHPVLAGAVTERDGLPWLVPAAGPVPVRQEHAAEPLDPILEREALRPFDLERGPLARMTLYTVGPSRAVLHLVAHHLAFDGESKGVFVRDLAACYAAYAAGAEPALPPLPDAAPDEARVVARLPAAWEFWHARWREPADPVLPGLVTGATGAAGGQAVEFALDDKLYLGLAETATALGVSRFDLLVTALLALLHRYGDPEPTLAVDVTTRTPRTRDRIGVHVNELPLRVRPAGTATDQLAAVRAELRELYRHRMAPLARAVPGLRPAAALAPVLLSYSRRAEPVAFPGVAATVDWLRFNHTARNVLRVQAVDTDDGLRFSLQYHPEVLPAGYPDRIADHLRTLLAALVADPDTPLADLPVLPDRERAEVLATAEPVRWPAGTVPELVATRATAHPDRTALIVDGAHVSYGSLDRRAAGIAAALAGTGPGTLVAVCARRGVDMVAGPLGVLRTGAAYLPLDPDYPPERLAFVLADAGARVLLTERALLPALPDHAGRVVLLDDIGPATAPVHRASPGDLAYVLYTSGSTGRPKGVEVTHGALANLLHAMRSLIGATDTDRWLALTSLSFDISALELFLPLVTGGSAVVAGEADTRDGDALLRLIDAHAVTHVQATPSGWRLLVDAGFDADQVTALAGGEALPVPLARALRARVRRLWNVYGPTETTIWSTAAEVPPDPARVTIGRPLANTRAYVLDGRLEPVPAGVPGELYLGGDGLARGYLGRPAVTAERFVPDPYGPAGGRLYRTGDRVRRGPDGELEFLGRTDNQVKLRGHRIELGEVEARLLAHPGVAAAAATVREDVPGDPRLVAYLVGPAVPAPADLRAHLARTLPAAMLPAAYVVLDRLPLTPNGKLDRAALPAPPAAAASPAPADPGDDPLVAAVREIWCEVLRVDTVGPDDDLFDLGGHSLSVTQINARVRRRLGVDVPLHVLFDTPTIAALVAEIRTIQNGETG